MDGLKREENGRFIEGTAPGPGRPVGQSLKEYWRQKFAKMTDEEKEEFSKKVTPEIIYRMAEGNPAQGIGIDPNLEPIELVVKIIRDANSNGNTTGV